MFGRRHKKYQRHSFLPFVIFRTLLSLVIFAILILGIYNAFKQFSGVDIIKINVLQRDILGLLTNLIPTGVSLPPQLETIREQPQNTPKTLSFKFILVADSHNDNKNLQKALSGGADFVIGLGDYTEVGTIDELNSAKKIFDSTGMRYYLTSGDHDQWDARNKGKKPTTNFNQVFGPASQSFSYKNARFLLIDNSDNYIGVDEGQRTWLKEEIDRINTEGSADVVLAFMHEPLYHPSSTRIMGKVTEDLRQQAKELAQILSEGGVSEIFAGDIHFFTRYTEPETGLPMTTIGALTSDRNAQAPRYGVVYIYEDGSFDVEDVEIK